MIFRSPYPDIAIPEMPLTSFVLRHAARLANKPALIDGPTGRTLTFGQFAEDVRRAANRVGGERLPQGRRHRRPRSQLA